MDNPDADADVERQYAEANEFLIQLAEEFVDSDRYRVVIVPGNHDVHWARARNAMEPLDACPDDINYTRFDSRAEARWDWEEQRAYRVVDHDLYTSRFEHFRRFQKDFYSGLNPNPVQRDGSDLVYFEYPNLGLVVVGFASWHGNDCFCHVGEIDSESIALSRQLLAASQAPTAVAVWHHSIVGGPRAHDYMDQRVVHRLIDFGFSVGLHGHRHYPGAVPFELRLPNLTSMAAVCAGSLAVGDRELPMGERRQFNIVDIDPEKESITVHVRAMSPEGVFTKSHRDDFGGETFIELCLPHSSARPKGPSVAQVVDDAMTASHLKQYEEALHLVKGLPPSQAPEIRLIKVMALEGLNRMDELVALLDPPESVDEAVRVIALLLNADRYDEAQALLERAAGLLDKSLHDGLARTISARRLAS